ncbi:MAG: hypothetical protein EBZ62_00050 [Sphingobacteriia bacterium]|nr:hypothetical protein [Sphingobacteriia bacterium]
MSLNNISVYYVKPGENAGSNNRLVPSPIINIEPEIYYANDSVIGYTYNITLTGYANALRLDLHQNSTDYGLDKVVDHMDSIRDIFNCNGGKLYVKDGLKTIIVAKGATIKNIDFEQTDIQSINYIKYTIKIEFNEVDLIGCLDNTSISCSESFFHSPIQSTPVTSDSLVDFKTYKIREFSDKWVFNTDDMIYDTFGNLPNSHFKVTYTISAKGKHYYQDDGTLIPSWVQAKLFVQDRLVKQVKGLISNILNKSNNDNSGCDPSLSIDQLYVISTSNSGILENFNTPSVGEGSINYQVYNEYITCDTSEAEGTYSITYNSILKKYDSGATAAQNAALHNFTQNITTTDNAQYNTTISVQGTVQGLIEGGFIYIDTNDYTLPSSGNHLISLPNGNQTKYDNAVASYNKYIGNGDDLIILKGAIGINASTLLVKNGSNILPSNFVLGHNYTEGTLTYSAEYNSAFNRSIVQGYTLATITIKNPVDLIQEYVIPGRANGPIIQRVGSRSPKVISVHLEGASDNVKDCGQAALCNVPVPAPQDLGFSNYDSWIVSTKKHNTNKIDGSWSMDIEYTCING